MCRIDIPIMRDTTGATRPFSYPQRTQSTRSASLEAGRASDAGERFLSWSAEPSKPTGFVGQLSSDDAPTRIIGRFGQAGFGQLRTRYIPDIEVRGAAHNGSGDLMRPVLANILNLGVNRFDAVLLARPLRHGKVVFVLAGEILTAVFHAIGTHDLIRQAKVNPDGVERQRQLGSVRHVALQADVPASAGVLDKASGFHLTLDGAREPQPEDAAQIDHRIFHELDGANLERYPPQRLLPAAPGQTGSILQYDLTEQADRKNGIILSNSKNRP
jgi:hypothetical protein